MKTQENFPPKENKAVFIEVPSFRNGLNYSKTSQGAEVKIVGVGDFKDRFNVPVDQLTLTKIEGSLYNDDRLEEGDILAVRSNGNRKLIGRTMLCCGASEPVSFSGFTIRIRLKGTSINCHLRFSDIENKGKFSTKREQSGIYRGALNSANVLPEYLCSFMRTKVARAALTAGGGGSNISNLNQRLLSSIPIAFPDKGAQREVLTTQVRQLGV